MNRILAASLAGAFLLSAPLAFAAEKADTPVTKTATAKPLEVKAGDAKTVPGAKAAKDQTAPLEVKSQAASAGKAKTVVPQTKTGEAKAPKAKAVPLEAKPITAKPASAPETTKAQLPADAPKTKAN